MKLVMESNSHFIFHASLKLIVCDQAHKLWTFFFNKSLKLVHLFIFIFLYRVEMNVEIGYEVTQ